MKICRRKHRPVPVSFFAFQDIITALAGCMLIFVLLMATAKNRYAGNESSDLIDRGGYDLLQNQIKFASARLAREKKAIKALQKEFDASEVSERMTEQNRLLKSSEKKLGKIAAERSKMLADMQKEFALLQKENQALAAEKKSLAAAVKEAAALEKEYLAQRKKLIFAEEKAKNILILTISRSNWELQSAADGKKILLGTAETALQPLKTRLGNHTAARSRLIIAVRPSAGGFIEPLKRELKRSFPAMEIVAEPLADEKLGGLEL